MITLSDRAKEAIKTALAMTIAYWIALEMDWEKAYWAGFAVAMISLATVGQSLNKAAMRMLGTLVAVAVALSLLAMFPQQRWIFIVLLSLYAGFCAYMMTGPRLQYFWFVAGFVSLVIVAGAQSDPVRAFQIAVERAQETGLGILVYSLVAALLWPRSSRNELETASRDLLDVQVRLFRGYSEQLSGGDGAVDTPALKTKELALRSRVSESLTAAAADSYAVWERRRTWRRFDRLSAELTECLERWRVTFDEIETVELERLIPGSATLLEELGLRFAEIERLLAGAPPQRSAREVPLAVDRDEIQRLPHFEAAAVSVHKAELETLGQLTAALLDCVAELRGHGAGAAPVSTAESPTSLPGLDPDRLAAGVTVATGILGAFLIWIFLDPPGHVHFVQLAGVMVMVTVLHPGPPPWSMILPYAAGILVTGLIYVFVLPQLSSYAELSVVVFLVTFASYYLFWQPRQILMRMALIVSFLVLTGIENTQSYDFASFANSAAMIVLCTFFVVAAAQVPVSPRPEKTLLRLVRRFFRLSDLLLTGIGHRYGLRPSLGEHLRAAYSRSELLSLPQRMRVSARQIDHASFPGVDPAEIEALIGGLDDMALRIKALLEMTARPQAEALVRELLEDVRAWRLVLVQAVRAWGLDPGADLGADRAERLEARMAALEQRIDETMRGVDDSSLTSGDYANLYRVLGALRGLSETMLVHYARARELDWRQLEEARF